MKKIALAIVGLLALLSITACRGTDAELAWAQNLKTSDVARIQIVGLPAASDRQYKDCEKTDFERIVGIINGAKGKRVDEPERLAGGALTIYVTLNDGTRHAFTNDGNVYLVIDGVSFSPRYEWLSGWSGEELNAALPQDFEF